MHTGHLVLIKAESHEDAIDKVRIALNPEEGTSPADWSDWCIVGDEGFGESRYSFDHEYEGWSGASKYAVSLADEANLFHTALNKMYELREKAFERFRDQIFELGVSIFKLDQNDQESWALYRFAELSDSIYNPESFIYDLENYTADLKYFRQSESEGETDWFAVLVDYHF